MYKGKANFAGEVASMPLNIKWDKSLYQSFDELCEAIFQLIIILSSILNPQYIVLNSNYLSEEHISIIRKRCSDKLSEDVLPEIIESKSFILDYQQGLIKETLAILEPDIVLTKR